MDVLEKIREEERAKLEALKEKEQEKTKLAIEKERARLEAELAKEIKDLESQLNRAKNASQNVKTRTPESAEIPSMIVDEDIDINNLEDNDNVQVEVSTTTNRNTSKPTKVKVERANDIEDFNTSTSKKPSTTKKSKVDKSLSTLRKTPSKTAAQRDKDKEKSKLAREKEKAKKLANEKEKAKLAKDNGQNKLIPDKVVEKVKTSLENEVKTLKQQTDLSISKTVEEQVHVTEVMKVEDEKGSVTVKAEDQNEVSRDNIEVDEQKVVENIEALPVVEEKPQFIQESEAVEVIEKNESEPIVEKQAEVKKEVEEVITEEIENNELQVKKDIDAVMKDVDNKTDNNKVEESTNRLVVDEKKVDEPVISKENLVETNDKVRETKSIIKPITEKSDMLPFKSTIEEPLKGKTDIQSKPNTAMTSLQKLREKIAAQKRLERELMEREAQRVQEKEKTLQDKFFSLQKIIEEEESVVTLEELEQERINVDNLRKEKEELENHLDNLQLIIDKVVDLKVDGIKVIDNQTWDLTEEFTNLGIDSIALNHTVSEIEEELDALSKSHEDYINKLIKAEENYKVLEELYQQQEKLIADLNKQVVSLREQVAKEKVLNREYSTQIEKLKGEKIRLERTYKYFRQTEDSLDIPNEGVYGILSDLDRLNDEVKKLLSNDESKKIKQEVEQKDLEIENLKLQIENLKNKQTQEQENLYPYYANGANMFIPRGFTYNPYIPQNGMLDLYLQELDKLKNEMETLKQIKMEEPVAKPEVFKDSITEIKANPIVQDEQIDEEPKVNQTQIEEAVLDNENIEKIKDLEEQIKEKDLYIEKLKQQMREYSEEDIFDPNFKRKIRVIRDKKSELLNRSREEEQVHLENTKDINSQINIIKLNIDGVKDRIFELDMNYRQNRDYSSAAKNEYEKAKGKALVELQLLEEKIKNYNDDLARVKQKFDRFLNNKEDELNKLNQEEVNTIQFYLNKMIQDNKINSKLKSTEEEKQSLVDELDQLKSDNTETEIDAYADEEKKVQINQTIDNLESQVKEQTRQYNIYFEKISELKAELNKRLELENSLKQNDEDVFEYTSTKQSLDDCENDYNQKNERISLLQLEIQSDNSNDKDSLLRKKAEISDLIVHREDLKTKMDYFKVKLQEHNTNENVSTYVKITNQISQIRKISKDHRLAAETLKSEIADKTNQLEKLRNELKML